MSAKKTSTKAPKATARATVLLFENDRAAFDGTASLLRRANFAVVHATTAVDALDVVRGARRIDVLVATIEIPDQPSGFTVARMARLRRPDLPVLYVGRPEQVDPKEAARALGPVLSPPVSEAALIEAVAAAAEAPPAA